MSTPAKRIDLLINALNLNINSFSKECGYPTSATIWRLINEGAKPSNPTLNKICNRFPQVNREWLMTGYGSMFTKQQDDDLTVTAKQVIDKLEPKFTTTETVKAFFKEFSEVKNQMAEIHEKLNSIEFIEALKMIKELQKKDKNIKL
tara:strand:+ start:157 stop:597 length:441 start_codon:yes stop_codon:yes gene_type:complete